MSDLQIICFIMLPLGMLALWGLCRFLDWLADDDWPDDF